MSARADLFVYQKHTYVKINAEFSVSRLISFKHHTELLPDLKTLKEVQYNSEQLLLSRCDNITRFVMIKLTITSSISLYLDSLFLMVNA